MFWGHEQIAPREARNILSTLLEGVSMRGVSWVVGVSINTVSKLFVDAGFVCARFHDEAVRGVECSNVQADKIWSFCYAKARNVGKAKAAPESGPRGPYKKKNSN